MLPPVRNLFIASEVRSGRTWVGELPAYFLERNGRQVSFGLTHETFRELDETSTAEQACRLYDSIWRDPSGLATAKLQSASLSLVYREAQQPSELMRRFFGADTASILLCRRDTLRQAVSLSTVRHSKRYHQFGNPQADTDLGVGHQDTNDAMAAILRSDLFLATFAERNHSTRILACDFERIRRQPEELLRAAFKLRAWDFPQDPAPADLTKLKPRAESSKAVATHDFGHCDRKPTSIARPPDTPAAPGPDTTGAAKTRRYRRRKLFGKGAWLQRGRR